MRQGKVRAIGASNLDATRLAEALAREPRRTSLPRYETLQPHYNLLVRDEFEGPLQQLCLREGIGVITYFSLAAGLPHRQVPLRGRFREERARAGPEEVPERAGRVGPAALEAVASAHGATMAQVALAWLMAQPGVTAPIASATSVAQLDELMAAARLRLTLRRRVAPRRSTRRGVERARTAQRPPWTVIARRRIACRPQRRSQARVVDPRNARVSGPLAAAATALLVPQRVDRRELRGLARRVEAEEHADRGGEAEREHHRRRRRARCASRRTRRRRPT